MCWPSLETTSAPIALVAHRHRRVGQRHTVGDRDDVGTLGREDRLHVHGSHPLTGCLRCRARCAAITAIDGSAAPGAKDVHDAASRRARQTVPPMNATALGTIKRGYAACARATGRLLERVGILGEDPPPREHRLRHWAYSLTRAHDSIGISKLDVPWWTYGAIDEVERWLAGRDGDVRAFEWGSGASTIWLARRVASVQLGGAPPRVRHDDPGAVDGVAERDVGHRRAGSQRSPAIGSAKEGHGGLDFSDYVRHIDGVGGMFDLIVVDGRAREACLSAALPHLEPDGHHRVRQHDAPPLPPGDRRRPGRRAIVPRPHPTLPYPDQTSILTRR